MMITGAEISKIHRHLRSMVNPRKQHAPGLLERLVEPSYFASPKLPRHMCDGIEQLANDWIFFDMFVKSMCKMSNAHKVLEDLGLKSVIEKFDLLVLEVSLALLKCDPNDPYTFTPGLLRHCRRQTDSCKRVIVEVLDSLSNYEFRVCPTDVHLWTIFLSTMIESLKSINYASDGGLNNQFYDLCDELELIHGYLGWVGKAVLKPKKYLKDDVINAFFTQVASVVMRIAHQSCQFYFNTPDPEVAKIRAAGIVDLRREIDLTDPEFMQLNLRFQEALYKIRLRKSGSDEPVFLRYFYDYLLPGNDESDLKMELISVVTIFIKYKQEDDYSGEDVHSFFAEINAMLGEVAFFNRSVRRKEKTSDMPPCPKILTKLCLLRAEFFLKEQLQTSTSSMLFNHNHFLQFHMILKKLRGFTKDLCQQAKTEYGKQSFVLKEELANELESLYVSVHFKNIPNSMVKRSLLQLLFKIVFFKVESFIADLLKSSDTSVAHVKDQIESLDGELKDFKRIGKNQLMRNLRGEEVIFKQVEDVARRITFWSYSFLPDIDKFKKMIFSLPKLLDKVKDIKAKLKEISQQFPEFHFPKTYKVGFVDFLGRNIRELLKYDPLSIAPVKHQIQEVQRHVEPLKSFLMKFSDVEQVELNDLGNHIIDVAYKLEYVLESIEVDGHLQHSLWFYDLLEDIRLVNQQVSEIPDMSYIGKVQNLPLITREMITLERTSAINEMVVDLGDEQEVIIDRLIRGFSQRDVVSIVGMPGIGKTTLAQKVYNNQNVMYHFHRRAWCTVSQVYSKRELLLEILSDIHGLTLDIREMTDDDLQAKLRQCLLKNRYLIIMDDVWDIKTWTDFQHSFPDDNNGSRILITSRLQDVALKIMPGREPHSIRLLSDDESWILLEKKIFKGEVCPEELLLVGKEIARHCQGLPLAVVAIAGLLQKTEKRQDKWKRISETLSSQIYNAPETRCAEILELSYKHLPEYLKACFLYLGVFFGDKDIPVSKLVRFWLAEGFIQKTDESKSLEDVAYDYLMELINRSLLIISKTRSNGKVKACRLHDLLRDLCHLKAEEENFLHLVTRNDEPYASFPDSDYEMEFDNSHLLVPVTFKCYRLGIYLKRSHFIDSAPSGLGIRSLIFFSSADSDPKCPYDISFICQNFKLLRLLDLESINMGVTFPIEIGLMVQLRYLAVSGYVHFIPPSIASLWKLETLVVKGLRGKVILPETIWSMTRLRHLHVGKHVTFELQGHDEQVGSSFHLENLVSFSTPSFSCGEDTMSILGRFPNLCKLRCILLESNDSSKNSNGFPTMEVLTQLESLKIIYYGKAPYSGELVLPLNLKKLTLSNFRLPWDHISRIGRLPNLEVLKLLAGAFEGQRWDMGEDEFKELKFLELDTLNIVEWNASCDPLPNLERLVLRNCKDLEKIPYDFAEINTLQTIEVQWCRPSVEESAKEIGDATGEIQIFITHS